MAVWFSSLYEWRVPLVLAFTLVGLGYMLRVVHRG